MVNKVADIKEIFFMTQLLCRGRGIFQVDEKNDPFFLSRFYIFPDENISEYRRLIFLVDLQYQ